MLLENIEENPKNPRSITKRRLQELMDSIEDFPKMMKLRPMVLIKVGNKYQPLGGNQRLKAIQEMGMTEIPDEWILFAEDLSEEEKKRFTIVDNTSFGEWDEDILVTDWDIQDIAAWGLDLPGLDEYKATKDIPDKGKMEFSESLLLEHNYVVLYFDDPMDWQVAMEKFGLKDVKTNTPDKSQKIGVGRVISGRKFLKDSL